MPHLTSQVLCETSSGSAALAALPSCVRLAARRIAIDVVAAAAARGAPTEKTSAFRGGSRRGAIARPRRIGVAVRTGRRVARGGGVARHSRRDASRGIGARLRHARARVAAATATSGTAATARLCDDERSVRYGRLHAKRGRRNSHCDHCCKDFSVHQRISISVVRRGPIAIRPAISQPLCRSRPPGHKRGRSLRRIPWPRSSAAYGRNRWFAQSSGQARNDPLRNAWRHIGGTAANAHTARDQGFVGFGRRERPGMASTLHGWLRSSFNQLRR
jgi:hypothetical protein